LEAAVVILHKVGGRVVFNFNYLLNKLTMTVTVSVRVYRHTVQPVSPDCIWYVYLATVSTNSNHTCCQKWE
jgi:hypothetical protein